MKKIIPYGKHCIFKSDILEINKVLKSNFLTTGPIIDKFERCFQKIYQSKICSCMFKWYRGYSSSP